jgi:predicted transcriptional regulator
MSESIVNKIEAKLKSTNKGRVFFISDFVSLGSEVSVRQALQRLVKKGTIIRLTKGIYYYPKKDELLGTIMPSAEQIAKAIAKRDKARIIPTGSYALYKLGLSNQIPMNVVYLTDGSPRKIQVGKQKITFKKTNPKNLAVKHQLSSLIIQGLKELGKDEISDNDIKQLEEIIKKSDEHEQIRQNMALAPIWIQKIINPIIKKYEIE